VTIRIGGVPYGVGAPLMAGLESDPAVSLVKAPPTALIAALRAGELDAALVSTIEAIERPGYRVVPGLGIACKREVRSVRAFRRRGVPLASIGVDASSATSVALLRILLARVHARDVAAGATFTQVAPTRTPDALPHDLVLLIGDHGLEADPGAREVWDLGQQWRALTGLPFVFAAWLCRPGVDAAAVVPVLHRARERSRAPGGRSQAGSDGTGGAVHYDLDDEDLRGLQRFYREARALGLGDAGARPAFLEGDYLEGASR
jgi:chorismate dehydratase